MFSIHYSFRLQNKKLRLHKNDQIFTLKEHLDMISLQTLVYSVFVVVTLVPSAFTSSVVTTVSFTLCGSLIGSSGGGTLSTLQPARKKNTIEAIAQL